MNKYPGRQATIEALQKGPEWEVRCPHGGHDWETLEGLALRTLLSGDWEIRSTAEPAPQYNCPPLCARCNRVHRGECADTTNPVPEVCRAPIEDFEKGLTRLINRHSIENMVDMPDFLLARMICGMLEAIGPNVKKALDWQRCDSVCHPAEEK